MDISTTGQHALLDVGYPEHEQLPRRFIADFVQRVDHDGRKRVQLVVDGIPAGDELGDNHYVDDGYRFHDVFHLAHAAVLGWSPLLRSLLGRKRKSDPEIDEVEDGGRSIMLEETISALTFDYAADHDWLVDQDEVDSDLLRMFKSLTSHLEVSVRSTADWELAVIRGVHVWQAIYSQEGGQISLDLPMRTIRAISEVKLSAGG